MPSIFDPLINDPEDEAQNKALIQALRQQTALGIVGQGMGLEATQQIGQGLQRGAQQSFGEAMQARERAKQMKMQQQQMAAEAAQRAQAQKNWQEQMDAGKRQFSAIADPITGAMKMYNTFTGEWQDGTGGTPPGANDKTPMGPTGFPKIPAGIKLPENASKNYIGSSMLAEHLPALEGMIAGGYTPNRKDLMAVGPPMQGAAGAVQNMTPREMAGPEAQQYYAVGGKILTAILRPESGGAITEDEWNQYGPLYLPWPGDDGKTVQTKLTALREYMRRLAAASGPAASFFVEPPPGQPGQTGRAEPRPGDKYLPQQQ
jgi:hypothetical protein